MTRTDYATDAEGAPYWCPEDGQAMLQSLPKDTGSTLQCVLCRRVYTIPQPPKLNRTNR